MRIYCDIDGSTETVLSNLWVSAGVPAWVRRAFLSPEVIHLCPDVLGLQLLAFTHAAQLHEARLTRPLVDKMKRSGDAHFGVCTQFLERFGHGPSTVERTVSSEHLDARTGGGGERGQVLLTLPRRCGILIKEVFLYDQTPLRFVTNLESP